MGLTSATFATYPLMDGPNNSFKFSYGTRPSFGYFRCKASHVAAMMAASPGTLEFTNGFGHKIAIPNCTVIKSIIGGKTTTTYDYADIVIADSRIAWAYQPTLKGFNYYPADLSLSGSDFAYAGLNGGSMWTFETLIDHLETLLTNTVIDFHSTINARKAYVPIHIYGLGFHNILAQLLDQFSCYIVPAQAVADLDVVTGTKTYTYGGGTDPTKTYYTIYGCGVVVTGDDTALITGPLHRQSDITLHPNISSAMDVCTVGVKNNSTTAPAPLAVITTGGTYQDTAVVPLAYTPSDANAATVSSRAAIIDACRQTALASARLEYVYGDIQPIAFSSRCQIIEWVLSGIETVTRVYGVLAREPLEPLPDTLYTHDRYFSSGGDGTATATTYYVLLAADHAYTSAPNNRWYQLTAAAETLTEYATSTEYATVGTRLKYTTTVTYGDPSRSEALIVTMTTKISFTSPSSGLPTPDQVTFDECWIGDRVNLVSGEADLRNYLPFFIVGNTTSAFASSSTTENITVDSRTIVLRHFTLTALMYLGTLDERSLHPFITDLDVVRIGAVFK